MFKKKQQAEKPRNEITWLRKGAPWVSGTLVKTEKGIFYIKSGRRYKVSASVLKTWNFLRPPITTNEECVAGLKVAGRLGFREGSLVKDISDNKMYVITDNKRRHIHSFESLLMIGAVLQDAITVTHNDILIHEEGEPLNVL